ncbi:hypothetical protein STEG23_032244 [Scotinomys teguina]
MLSIQKWQFSMSAIKEQELMEEMNEDEPVKAKEGKREDSKDIDSEKEAAMEAEIKAARERAIVSLEAQMKHLEDMLLERGVSAFSTWEKVVFDHGYLLLNPEERKQVFDQEDEFMNTQQLWLCEQDQYNETPVVQRGSLHGATLDEELQQALFIKAQIKYHHISAQIKYYHSKVVIKQREQMPSPYHMKKCWLKRAE